MTATAEKEKKAEAVSPNGQATLAKPREARVTTQVLAQVEDLRNKGRLQLPADYSAGNALNQAWLILQAIENKDHQSIFTNGLPTGIVTVESIASALMAMVIQGLNPEKKQGYFIVYGKRLTWQRSYHGDKALAERLVPGIVIFGDVVTTGEKIVKAKRRTTKGFVTVITDHQMVEKRDINKIEQVYVGAFLADPETGTLLDNSDFDTTIMTIEQCKMSWKKSKTMNADSFHNQQPDQACLRTAMRRFTKPIINSSNDALLMEALQSQEDESILAEASDVIDEHANSEALSLAQNAESVVTAPVAAAEPEKTPVTTAAASDPPADAGQKKLDEYDE